MLVHFCDCKLNLKNMTTSKTLLLSILCAIPLVSCSKIESMTQKEQSLSFISISKEVLLSGQDIDSETQGFYNEAKHRFVSHIKTSEDGSLIMDKSAEDLRICSDLYDLFHMVYISLPNAKQLSVKTLMTKSIIDDTLVFDDGFALDSLLEEGTGTRGNRTAIDMVAQAIEGIALLHGWSSTANLWHMWYFDMRTSPYTLSASEWDAVKSGAEAEFRRHPEWGPGEHQINYANQSDSDLRYSYGTATANFDAYGNCIGFRDTYDMNWMRGQRRDWDELLTELLSYIDGDGGFTISYGITQ